MTQVPLFYYLQFYCGGLITEKNISHNVLIKFDDLLTKFSPDC